MSEELKPCPFCGGSACLERGFNYDYDGGDRWYVYSADVACSCGCTLHVDNALPKKYVSEEHSLDFAIAAWNRRATDADDVLQSIDQLRRDLSGYHGQLKAHNDLKKHCENQRKRIGELEELYAKAKAERDETAMAFSKEHDRAEFLTRKNAKLRELVRDMWFWGYEGHMDSKSQEWQMNHIDGVLDCMRELGIEVE